MPGVNVTITNASSPSSRPTATGKLFAVVQTERGSTTEAVAVNSISEFKNKFGQKLAASIAMEAAEAFFGEGGSELIVGRAIGAEAKAAAIEFEDGAKSKKVLKVTAKSVGEWGNKLSVQVKAGAEEGKYLLIVTESGTQVEESPEFTTNTEAVEWSEKTSQYINVESKFATQPGAIAATALKTGSDGAELNTASVEGALALFLKDMGCGQVVSWVNGTASAVQKVVMKHGESFNRTPLIDIKRKAVSETLAEYEAAVIAAVSSLRTSVGARRSAAFAQWAIIPGLAAGTTRFAPYSAIQAGLLARHDELTFVPRVGEPAAGERGRMRYGLGLEAVFSRAQRDTLNEHGLIPARVVPGGLGVETYGNRTLVKPESEPSWEKLSSARLFMYVVSQGEAILERSAFRDIDGKGLLFQKIGGELTAFMETLSDQINNNPNESVNVGPGINTKETIRKNEVWAEVTVQPDTVAEVLTLNVVVQPAL